MNRRDLIDYLADRVEQRLQQMPRDYDRISGRVTAQAVLAAFSGPTVGPHQDQISARVVANLRAGQPVRAAVRDAVTAVYPDDQPAEQAGGAPAAPVDRHGGRSFGDALLDRAGNRPTQSDRRARPTRMWDDLSGAERVLVAGYMSSTDRGGEEPSRHDIADALNALSGIR